MDTTPKTWDCIILPKLKIIEVFPLADTREHLLQPARCWCGPVITHHGGGWLLYLHARPGPWDGWDQANMEAQIDKKARQMRSRHGRETGE